MKQLSMCVAPLLFWTLPAHALNSSLSPASFTTGTITSFTSSAKGYLDIGGDSYYVQGPGKSYNLTNPDPQTLQFEIQPGDHAWFDGSDVDRSEVSGGPTGSTGTPYIPPGTPIAIDYQLMVQPNGPNNTFTNTAWFFVAGEMHDGGSVSGTSPPFAVQLAGDHLQVVARYVSPGGNPSNGSSDLHMMTLWTDPNPITPGEYNDIDIHANVSNSGGGYLQVSVNGTQVVNYSGPLGYGSQTYWEEGLYRNAGPTESATADFRNLTLVTGSQAAGWAGVGGTTSGGTTVTNPTGPTSSGGTSGSGATSPSTPVAPTLTVADQTLSISAGGHVALGVGVNVPHAGDNVTVNVSGMPGYESITDNLDHKTFSGGSVTLTAAEVNSGLTLNSSYNGRGDPSSTLTVTATDHTGTPISSAPQTITVADPPATTVSGAGSTGDWGRGGWPGQGTPTASQPPSFGWTTGAGGSNPSSPIGFTSPTTSTWSDQSSQNGRFGLAQWFDQHPDFAPVATTLSEAGASRWGTGFEAPAATAPVEGVGSRSFALFNQMMAGNFGSESHFATATTTSSGASPQTQGFLAQPLH